MAIKTNKAIKISQKHLLGIQDLSINDVNLRSEERRVGKECRSRWSPYH